MSVTSDYARIRGAFSRIARGRSLHVADVQLLVAVLELGNAVSTDKLYEAMACEPSGIRRSLGRLYALGYATGRGVDGGARRAGVFSVVSLTNHGRVAAREALDLIHGHAILQAAA